MTKKFFVPGLAALALLGACATATPYQPATPNARGYSNQQIESNRWMVSFAGNSLTDRQTVETYLLYRAAELTSQNGYDYFRVVRRATDAGLWCATPAKTYPAPQPPQTGAQQNRHRHGTDNEHPDRGFHRIRLCRGLRGD